MKINKILLTTDFSEAAKKAYPVAIDIAKKQGASLTLVHAAEKFSIATLFSQGRVGALDINNYEDELKDKLAQEADSNFNSLGDSLDKKLLIGGYPAEMVRDFIEREGIDLVVTSTHGWTGVPHVVLGSFTEKIILTSTAPVLTVPAAKTIEGFDPQKILVPFDFSPNAKELLPLLQTLTKEENSETHFLYVLEPLVDYWVESSNPVLSEIHDEALQAAPTVLNKKFNETCSEDFPNAKLIIKEGLIPEEILDYSKDLGSDLIVQSTQGWSGWSFSLLGSVSGEVLRMAQCPVLTVRNLNPSED